jgi:hypothetical protein
VIASQSGHCLPPLSAEQNAALAMTPVEELLTLRVARDDLGVVAEQLASDWSQISPIKQRLAEISDRFCGQLIAPAR